jgi:mannitol/fructose-specific phosphotransferase system IIA component (Ntr-type)
MVQARSLPLFMDPRHSGDPPRTLNLPDTVTTIAPYTSTGLIVSQLRGRSPAAAIGELCSCFGRENRVNDLLSFYNSVMTLEQVSTTATPPGWAMPHARVKGLARLSFAVGRIAEPLDWYGHGGIRLVFLFAVPETDGITYRAVLSGLARLSRTPVMRDSLIEAPDSHAMFEVLRQVRMRSPKPGTALPIPGRRVGPRSAILI